MSGLLRDFRRVTPRAPCDVCGHGGWCLRARDGSARAICNRVPSPRRWGGAGWFHGTLTSQRGPRKYHLDETPDESRFRLIVDACLARAADKPGSIENLATGLGVSVAALQGLSVGLDERGRTTWPMRDHLGRLVGIRERFRGKKRAVKGSRNGLFLPHVPEESTVLVTEGESDCAAALTLGFYAIGRPGCEGATRHLARWIQARSGREVVIVADADAHGRGLAGATALAGTLAVFCPTVRVVLPPRGRKDLREAVRAGVDRSEILDAIKRAPIVRAIVATRGGP